MVNMVDNLINAFVDSLHIVANLIKNFPNSVFVIFDL